MTQQKVDYRNLCDNVLFSLQPPESLTQDLLKHNAGVWYQKAPYGQKITKETPWVWHWNHYVALQMSFPQISFEKIKEWIGICKGQANVEKS